MLELLRNIYNFISLSSRSHTITATSHVLDTTIAAGAKQVIITTNGTYAGNINGVAGVASTIYRFDAFLGYTLPAIPITRSAGGFTVTTVI
jgi:hypothetical protein